MFEVQVLFFRCEDSFNCKFKPSSRNDDFFIHIGPGGSSWLWKAKELAVTIIEEWPGMISFL